jgi:hypothetical protein
VSAEEWSTAWPSSTVPDNGGEAPIDKERFVNARAEDYWTLRERFEQGEIDIDPDDDKLAAQLGSIKWVELCEKTETDERAMVESPDKSSLVKVVEDLAETADPEGVMASQFA